MILWLLSALQLLAVVVILAIVVIIVYGIIAGIRNHTAKQKFTIDKSCDECFYYKQGRVKK